MCMCVRVWGRECCTPASIRETPVGNQRTEDRSLAPVASCFSAGIPAGSTPQTTSSCPAAPCHSSSSSYPTSETTLPSDALQEWSYYPKLPVPGRLIILWRFPQPWPPIFKHSRCQIMFTASSEWALTWLTRGSITQPQITASPAHCHVQARRPSAFRGKLSASTSAFSGICCSPLCLIYPSTVSIHSFKIQSVVQQLDKAFSDLLNTVLPHTSLREMMSVFPFVTQQDTSTLCVINANWLLLGLSEIQSFFPGQWSIIGGSKNLPSGTVSPCNHWRGY